MTALNVFVLKGYICTITVYNKLCMKKKSKLSLWWSKEVNIQTNKVQMDPSGIYILFFPDYQQKRQLVLANKRREVIG